MKKRKLCLIFMIPLLLFTSCSNNASGINKEIDMYINDAEFKTFDDSNDEYTVFIRLDNGKSVILYENLFGSSKENNFLIQYDYDYSCCFRLFSVVLVTVRLFWVVLHFYSLLELHL